MRLARRIAAESERWGGSDNILAALAGSWSLSRTVDNGASMTGAASFADRGNGQFDYHERVELRLADRRSVEGERRYIFAEIAGGFAVLFAERPPRPFHRIALTHAGASLVGSGTHRCDDDRYDSRYAFRPDGTFTIEHAVVGPRKRYVISTRYTRRQPD